MTLPLAGLRIGLLTASASRDGGGVFEAVVQQAAMIRSLGGEAPVFALADRYSAEDAHRFGGSALSHSAVRGPGQIGYAPDLLPCLLAAELDLLHLHGIWMYPSRAALLWTQRTGQRSIVSPHGMLDRWITGRGRWKKALARAGYERASWRAASVLHALTGSEAEDLAREAGRSDALIIPNAGPSVASPPVAPGPPNLVYIGRIHPKKNLLALVDGWKRAARPAEARLELAGWGDPGHVAALEAAAEAAGPSVRFHGPVFGAAKHALLSSARFSVLPSLSEGLPMAMLESWAQGVPTLMTRACNLPDGFAAGAALECGPDAAAIAVAIEQALGLAELAWLAMARAARELAGGPFSATTVAAMWAAAYRGEPIAQGSAVP